MYRKKEKTYLPHFILIQYSINYYMGASIAQLTKVWCIQELYRPDLRWQGNILNKNYGRQLNKNIMLREYFDLCEGAMGVITKGLLLDTFNWGEGAMGVITKGL